LPLPLASGRPRFCWWSGPRAASSRAEVEALARAGFVAASLGPRILRSETAAVAAVAVAQALWGDLGASPP
jgi:16S rRNA (uracil1498-N3)-methyltransferase